jgi:hypothetical protein
MRLCGHDCVVRGRYDPGSAGSGRYFYRLDPQDPLNFGIILLSLLLRGGAASYPQSGVYRVADGKVAPRWHGIGAYM